MNYCKHRNSQVLSGEPCPKCGLYCKAPKSALVKAIAKRRGYKVIDYRLDRRKT